MIATAAIAETIERTWCELLCVERVPADKSFFVAGGDSLLATFAAEELSRRLPIPLSVYDLYKHPTIERLTGHIASQLMLAAQT